MAELAAGLEEPLDLEEPSDLEEHSDLAQEVLPSSSWGQGSRVPTPSVSWLFGGHCGSRQLRLVTRLFLSWLPV